MRVSFFTDDLSQLKTDVLGLVCFEDQLGDGVLFQSLDKTLEGLIGRLMPEERFKAKKGQTLLVHTHGRVGAARLLLLGAGPRKDFQASDLRGVAARVARAAVACSGKSASVVMPYLEGAVQDRAAQFLVEGALPVPGV